MELRLSGFLWWVYARACVCVCVWTTLQLSISSSMVISHRASPLCSAIPRSSSGWTVCHFSLQRFSHFFKAQRGVAEQSLVWLPLFLYPLRTFFFLPPSSVKSLGSSPSWADSTILQGSEGFPVSLFFSFSHPVPRRCANKEGKYTSNNTCQTIGISCSNVKAWWKNRQKLLTKTCKYYGSKS